MRKITKFADIPKFIRCGSYEVDFDIRGLVRWVREQQQECGLDLEPDFQRAHVWSERQQIAWLEFILRGGTTSRVIYFNNPHWHRDESKYKEFVIVDGKQRLRAMTRFIDDEIPVFGSLFSEYTDSPRILYTVKANVNDLRTRREVLTWYIDFNSGGVVHTEEELQRVRDLIAKEN